MSELGEIHEKVNAMGKGVARIEGILDTALPHLATHDQVDLKIANHAAATKPSLLPGANGNTKRIAALSGVVVALSGLLIYLVKMVIF